jgi:hypothetical protein
LGSKDLLVTKVRQRTQRTGYRQVDVTTSAAVATVGRTTWLKTQAFKTDAPGSTLAGFYRDFGFIGKVPTWQFSFS